MSPVGAAEAVGVARQTVYTWKALLDEGGIDVLRAVPDPGRPARLSDMQLAQVRAALLQSPTEHGFGTGFGPSSASASSSTGLPVCALTRRKPRVR